MRSIGKFKRYKLSKGNKAMGMAASQSRLLTLTARMSDLEYKAQGITNSKLRLSVKTEDVARAYSDALNKERLSVLTNVTSSKNTYSDLSYENLCGKDSPLSPAQYGLSTPGGGILVSKEVAANFAAAKANGGLNKFLELSGAGGTMTYPEGVTEAKYTEAQGKLDHAKETYLGTDGTGATSGSKFEAAEALKSLDAYGALHVDGTYSSGGVWTRTDTTTPPVTPQVTPPTNTKVYTEDAVFTELSKLSYADMFGSPLKYQQTDDVKSVDHFSQSDPNYVLHGVNSFQQELAALVTDVTGDVEKALTNGLASTVDKTKFATAITAAKAATQAIYLASAKTAGATSIPYQKGPSGADAAKAATVGNTTIQRDGNGGSYIDITQMVKTFLTAFDTAFAAAGTGDTPPQTGGNNSAQRRVTGLRTGNTTPTTGTGSRTGNTTPRTGNTTPTTVTYSSTDADADNELKMKGYTAPDTEDSVKAEYLRLRSDYNTKHSAEGTDSSAYSAAQSELTALGTPTVTQSEYTPYFTSLYNRMLDGYSTVGKDVDEDTTLNNPAWIQKQILNHNFTLEKVGSDGNWKKISLSEDTSILKENDDRDMAKAEADYKVATAEIENKDKRFDLELQDIETEHTAIQTEVDSVKKVIDKNIDRTFKNFSA